MSEFIVIAIALTFLAAAFIVVPVLLQHRCEGQNRRQINTALFKERLAELSRERDQEQITEHEFQHAKVELQRRLLDDVGAEQAPSERATGRPWGVISALLVFMPLMAWFLYGQIGAQADWKMATTLKQISLTEAAGRDSRKQREQLAALLSQRLEQRPGQPRYLMLLASTWMSLQNYPAATALYQQMTSLAPDDANVLAQYAQALYLSSNRQINARVSHIIDQVLALQPDQPTVLGMLGIASFERRDYHGAIDYWQRLLPALNPTSPNAVMIRRGIEQAKALLAQQEVSADQVDRINDKTPGDSSAAPGSASLQVNVSIADNLSAAPGTAVFVFARAIKGPPMPLAVARLTVAELPARITLSDSMAMTPGLKLSNFDQVEVIARVSHKGIASASPGDMEGATGPVAVNAAKGPVTLSINRILP